MRAPWNISNFPLEDHRYSEACYGKCHPGSFGKKSPRPDFPLHFGMKRNYGYSLVMITVGCLQAKKKKKN